MYRSIIVCCIYISMQMPMLAFSQDGGPQEELTCGEIKGVKGFVACALKSHPSIKESKYDERRAEGLREQARLLPNPEIEADFSQTDNIGQTSETVELKLMVPIEIGGKRGARIQKSKAESNLINSEILKAKETVIINSIINLYRLRQVIDELELTKESLATFGKVKGQYSKRKSLGPEQAVSFDIFSLAEADYAMRQSALESEKQELIRELSLYIDKKFEISEGVLPDYISDWPVLPSDSDLVGSDIKIIEAKKEVAEGELEVSKSEAWPDIAIGPTYSMETENNDQISTVGLSLSMPLPLFNRNSGNKTVALAEKQKAELRLVAQGRNYKNMRANLIEIYRSISNRFRKVNPSKLSKVKHKRIHKYLKRGVVAATLVIESHRQIVEFQEHTNEQELRALSALWQVRALDGTIFSEIDNL